jgi:signal transduction histidine kinase
VLTRVKWAANVLTDNALFEPRSIRARDLAVAAAQKIAINRGRDEAARIDIRGGEGLDVQCDKPLAVDALAEVLDNALAFSPPGSPVHLGIVQAAASRVRFEIRDLGPGIPEHILERGFESFRTGSERPGKQVGLGLGLPTARTIVERHGGYFSLMSEVGIGTEVFLSFPSRTGAGAVKSR